MDTSTLDTTTDKSGDPTLTTSAGGDPQIGGHPRPRSKRARGAVAALLMLSALIGGVSAGIDAEPAAAAGVTQCSSRGCDLFAFGPRNGYFFSTPGGARVGMICWKDSVYYAGSVRWFYVSTIYGNGRAWVPANQVVNQTTVRRC